MLSSAFLIFGAILSLASAVYQIPPVTIEVFQPKGFRAYIPDEPGIDLFAFHGKVNNSLGESEPGEFNEDIKNPTDGFWIYENPNLKLEINDVIHYWVFVQHNRLGYRKENKWEVKGYTQRQSLKCTLSMTAVPGKSGDLCRDSVIFEENFGDIDQSRWIIEQYIPIKGPNYEFNSYENDVSTVITYNSELRITPIPKQTDRDVRGTLDLSFHCTKKNRDECIFTHFGALYLPPVKSGKIRSKFSFTYGKIEVRAKLPAGDWIFPEIALIPEDQLNDADPPKMWIAYARGNEKLTGEQKDDIGGNILFAGEMLSATEPKRSAKLVSRRGSEPFSRDMHLYTLIWSPGKVTALVDNSKIGEQVLTTSFEKCVISLGVGVGGINDFPDGYQSGMYSKPWKNKDLKQTRAFFNARNEWLTTWRGNDTQLQIDYVKVYAL